MPPEGVAIIGERINYSIARVRPLFDTWDAAGIAALAREQAERGVEALDLNVGPLGADVMRKTVETVQGAVKVPLSLDSASPEMLREGLEAIDPKASDGLPILNSATEARIETMVALRRVQRCRVILLVSERRAGERIAPNESVTESLGTAKRLLAKAVEAGFEPAELLIDPSTPALAADLKGLVGTALDAIAAVRADGEMEGVRIVAGLSNLTASLPPAIRLPLQNAFLTIARRNGLDTIIGDPGRDYRILGEGDPALALLEEILARKGSDRLKALTSSPLYRSAAEKAARRNEGARHRGGSA